MKKSILVIDDCEVTRERLGRILGEGCKVLLAANASEGMRTLCADIRVVLLDYVLPDADGITVLKEIKTRHPSIPVIIITGYGTEEVCQQSFKNGAIDYVKKPFDTGEIKKKVKLLLNLKDRGSARRQPLFLESPEEASEEFPSAIPSPVKDGIIRAKKYIDEHYRADLDISQMVREAAMNKTYFCHYFKLATGHTFKDYLTCKRLRMAKELLRNEELRIDEIAEQVGYSSKHFSEVFKKFFGIPPKKLRT